MRGKFPLETIIRQDKYALISKIYQQRHNQRDFLSVPVTIERSKHIWSVKNTVKLSQNRKQKQPGEIRDFLNFNAEIGFHSNPGPLAP